MQSSGRWVGKLLIKISLLRQRNDGFNHSRPTKGFVVGQSCPKDKRKKLLLVKVFWLDNIAPVVVFYAPLYRKKHMQLSRQALEEFKMIYKKNYNIALSNSEALELATSFVILMQAVYHPLPDENCQPAHEDVQSVQSK